MYIYDHEIVSCVSYISSNRFGVFFLRKGKPHGLYHKRPIASYLCGREPMPPRMLVLIAFGHNYLCINPSQQTDTCITDGEGYFELRYRHLRKCEHAPYVDLEYPGWIGSLT
jgi:hypothetical protein